MSMGIYKITNKINGKSYIGQSIDIKKRWYQHQNNFNNLDTTLYQAFKKYGIENFAFEIIEECQVQDLDEKEIYWIKYYNTYNSGYNETLGGEGTKGRGSRLKQKDIQEIIKLLKDISITEIEISKKFNVSLNIISRINMGKSWVQQDIKYPIREKVRTHSCKRCGAKITYYGENCEKCSAYLRRVVERPTREELKNLIRTESFLEIGRIYGVSDNAIRKWCDSENLPRKKGDIKKYTDEEWALI